MTGYVTIGLPLKLVRMVDEFIKNHPSSSYTNRSDLVKHAVRDFLYRHSNNYQPVNKNNKGGEDEVKKT